MKKKLVKLLTICLSIATLALSHSSASFASFETDTTPRDYIMLVTLQSCGIYAYNSVSQWIKAYEGYLKSTNNTVLLNQFNSYSGLSWGDTVTGIDSLYQIANAMACLLYSFVLHYF